MTGESRWRGPAPGWLPDPWGEASHRYWNGNEWTGHLSDTGPGGHAAPGEAPTQVLSGPPGQGPPDGGRGAPANQWIGSNWPWLVALLAGLVVGGAIAGASSNTSTTTELSVATATQTQTRIETVAKVKTVHETAPAPGGAGGSGNSFTGDGEKNLGTIEVPVESVLRWQASGGEFIISNDVVQDANTIDVASQAGSGTTTVAPGTYHKVGVLAVGPWSLTITPK